jgi:hypothetical protein
VNVVRNDYGELDDWPALARYLVPDAGASGRTGFTTTHPLLLQQPFPKHGHSDYFHRKHFTDYWIPTLMRPVVSRQEQLRFANLLDVTSQAVAATLRLMPGLVRANVFLPDERGLLRIPDGLVHNMPSELERTLTIEPGRGCSGTSFKEGQQVIAIFHRDWGRHTLPQSELAKVDPRVRWIISTPIPDPDLAGARVGVVSVDGLDEERTKEALSAARVNIQGDCMSGDGTMKYRYEHRTLVSESGDLQGVADLYVVRDLAERPALSPEFLGRMDGLLAPTQAILRRLVELGFPSATRK